MTVGTHAEPDEIESRWLVAARAEREPQLALVGERGRIEVGRLGRHAMDAVGSHVRQLRDEHPVGDTEVRLGVVGRDGALVAPEELDCLPLDRISA